MSELPHDHHFLQQLSLAARLVFTLNLVLGTCRQLQSLESHVQSGTTLVLPPHAMLDLLVGEFAPENRIVLVVSVITCSVEQAVLLGLLAQYYS